MWATAVLALAALAALPCCLGDRAATGRGLLQSGPASNTTGASSDLALPDLWSTPAGLTAQQAAALAGDWVAGVRCRLHLTACPPAAGLFAAAI